MLNRSNSSSKSQTRHDIYTTQSATLSHFHFPLWDLHGDTLARATPTPTPNNVYIHCAPCESMHDSERFGWKLDCKSSHIYIYIYIEVLRWYVCQERDGHCHTKQGWRGLKGRSFTLDRSCLNITMHVHCHHNYHHHLPFILECLAIIIIIPVLIWWRDIFIYESRTI